MDYSVNGILLMLQDLQRQYFGKMTVMLNTFVSDESGPYLSCTVFKGEDTYLETFYDSYESDAERREKYMRLLTIFKSFDE